MKKWQRAKVKVSGAPTKKRSVQRHDKGFATTSLRSAKKADHQPVVRTPIELEPPYSVTHRSGAGFHGHGSLVRKDERDSLCRSCPGRCQIGVRMSHFQYADGS